MNSNARGLRYHIIIQPRTTSLAVAALDGSTAEGHGPSNMHILPQQRENALLVLVAPD